MSLVGFVAPSVHCRWVGDTSVRWESVHEWNEDVAGEGRRKEAWRELVFQRSVLLAWCMVLCTKGLLVCVQDFQSGVLSSDTCLSTSAKLQSLYKDVTRVFQCARQSKGGVYCTAEKHYLCKPILPPMWHAQSICIQCNTSTCLLVDASTFCVKRYHTTIDTWWQHWCVISGVFHFVWRQFGIHARTVAHFAADGVPLKQVGEVGGATVTPSASTGSWAGRVPGSFVPEPPPQLESTNNQGLPSKVSYAAILVWLIHTEGNSGSRNWLFLTI